MQSPLIGLKSIMVLPFLLFTSLTRCLQKIVEKNATLILVVPMWPIQVWFSRLLSLNVNFPPSTRGRQNVLTRPLLELTHSRRSNLTLMACKVSGDTSLKQPHFTEHCHGHHSIMETRYSETVYINRRTKFCNTRFPCSQL